MEKLVTSDYVPPAKGQLMWIFIDPPGKPDLNGKPRFVASLYVEKDSDECKALEKCIDDFWDDNKPKGSRCKSKGYREVMIPDPDFDGDKADAPQVPMDPPIMAFNFWTGTTYQDGNTRKLDIYNAKGTKVSLGGKKIGNGSKGAISGNMDIYDNGPAARGVTLYLTAIQLTKFVPYEGADAGFGAQEVDDEDAFMGVDEEFPEAEDNAEGKPRL